MFLNCFFWVSGISCLSAIVALGSSNNSDYVALLENILVLKLITLIILHEQKYNYLLLWEKCATNDLGTRIYIIAPF